METNTVRLSLSEEATSGDCLELHMGVLLEKVERVRSGLQSANGGHGDIRITPEKSLLGQVSMLVHYDEPVTGAVRQMVGCSDTRTIIVSYEQPYSTIRLPKK